MKIAIDKNVVEITPESSQETEQLDSLWKVVVDCMASNKKLVPIGEFVPGKTELARFAIEE
ncbi:hypothetical protein [Desulfopila sp. IMCC35008]|uniref:hypothetical protein n=1 Tax=Desulfopila sp. IMCC35008 TaxID=2653858 RepID=UPI0013D87169|nr:hypothetical protein [Desulfopila sp. IMCC35008]